MRTWKKHPTLSPEKLDEAYHAHEAGASWDAVAIMHDMQRHALCKQLRAAGYVLTKNPSCFSQEWEAPSGTTKAEAAAAAMRGFNPISQQYLSIKL